MSARLLPQRPWWTVLTVDTLSGSLLRAQSRSRTRMRLARLVERRAARLSERDVRVLGPFRAELEADVLLAHGLTRTARPEHLDRTARRHP